MKYFINRQLFNNIFVFFLICFFLFLIIYQLYLANKYNYHFRENHSKWMEGFSQINNQNPIDCNSDNLSSVISNAVEKDINNISILSNDITNTSSQLTPLLGESDTRTKLNNITSPTLNDSSTITDICNAIKTNRYNLSQLNTNINNIYQDALQISNGQTTTFTALTSNNITYPCAPENNINMTSLCSSENTNISSINTLSTNVMTLNNFVTTLQNDQKNKATNQNNSANTIANSVGVNN